MKLLEVVQLPVLVDGNTVYLKDGEKLIRVVAYGDSNSPYHAYVSSLSEPIVRGGHYFLKTFRMSDDGNPSGRFWTTVPMYDIQPYPEDAQLWDQYFGDVEIP